MDRSPEIEGYYICTGMSGHGFKLGPVVGEMMAELIMTDTCPEIDIRDYRLEHFAEDALIKVFLEWDSKVKRRGKLDKPVLLAIQQNFT